jgi:threonine/homoserine/homoserine lactone efflux protein
VLPPGAAEARLEGMEMLALLFGGMMVGVAVAAPVGPVNLICIRRTLAFGRLNGFLSGAGAALGDGIFALIVAFGLTAVSQWILGFAGFIQTIGAFVLIGLGVHTYFADPRPYANPEAAALPDPEADKRGGGLVGAVTSTFLLTITNPATMLGFVAIFSGFGKSLTADASYLSAAVLVGAVIAGSALWWLTLTMITGLFKVRVTRKRLVQINRISGVVIAAFGVIVLGKVIVDAIG